jgi:hypothetical protein
MEGMCTDAVTYRIGDSIRLSQQTWWGIEQPGDQQCRTQTDYHDPAEST